MPRPSGTLEIAADSMPIYTPGGIEIVSQSGATRKSTNAPPAPVPGAGGAERAVTFVRSGTATIAVAGAPTPTGAGRAVTFVPSGKATIAVAGTPTPAGSSVTVTFTSLPSAVTPTANGSKGRAAAGRHVTFTSKLTGPTPSANRRVPPTRPSPANRGAPRATPSPKSTKKATGGSTKSRRPITHKQTAAKKKAIAVHIAEGAVREKIAKEKAVGAAVHKAVAKVHGLS
ncbi:hypothetical protein HDU86_003321 [Geranomyces michiganensis]|nr:hypothetical protein HDU86_003321 [Geranomyces michiganensis]